MKCKLNKSELEAALKKLKLAIPVNPALPILRNLLVKINRNEAVLIATDLEVTIIYTISCESDKRFSMIIPFSDLEHIIGVVGSDITIEDNEGSPVVRCFHDKFALGKQDAVTEYPKMPDMPEQYAVKINSGLIQNINRAALSVSPDKTNCKGYIALDFKGDKVTIVGTDANTLFMKEITFTGKDINDEALITTKVAKALDGFEETTITFNDSHIAFSFDKMNVITTRSQMKMINYRAAIKDYEFNLNVDTSELDAALDKLTIAEAGNGFETLLKFSPDVIDLESNSVETGREVSTMVNCSYSGSVEKMSLSAHRFLIALKQLKDYKSLKMAVFAYNRPINIRPEEDASMLLLIMPIINK